MPLIDGLSRSILGCYGPKSTFGLENWCAARYLQEFVELVRLGDTVGAIAYGRQHLSQWAGPFEAEMQRAFAVLVFTADTQCPRYQVGVPHPLLATML